MDFDDIDDIDELENPDVDDDAWWGADESEDEPHVGSAWEFGTAAAVAGYLLDRQTERLEQALERTPLPPPQPSPPSAGTAVRPEYLDLPEAAPLNWSAEPLTAGSVLERSRLAVTVGRRLAGTWMCLRCRLRSRAGRTRGVARVGAESLASPPRSVPLLLPAHLTAGRSSIWRAPAYCCA